MGLLDLITSNSRAVLGIIWPGDVVPEVRGLPVWEEAIAISRFHGPKGRKGWNGVNL